MPCVCARPSDTPKRCWSAAPRARPLILQSRPRMFSEIALEASESELIARWQAGAQTPTQFWTLPSNQRDVKVLSSTKSLNKLCRVESYYVCWKCQNWGKRWVVSSPHSPRLEPPSGFRCIKQHDIRWQTRWLSKCNGIAACTFLTHKECKHAI